MAGLCGPAPLAGGHAQFVHSYYKADRLTPTAFSVAGRSTHRRGYSLIHGGGRGGGLLAPQERVATGSLTMPLFTMGLSTRAGASRHCGRQLWRYSLGVAQGFALGLSAVVIAPGAVQPVQAEAGAEDETALLEPKVVGKFVRGKCFPACGNSHLERQQNPHFQHPKNV
eukprot:COSAG02_NODE_1722_length_11193_cov_39.876600_1_plen_169_part_00